MWYALVIYVIRRTGIGAKFRKFLQLASVAVVTVVAVLVYQRIIHNAAEQVNVETTEQGFKALSRAMDFMSSLQQAKADNDLLARKVYAERSIIFAGIREMQQSMVEVYLAFEKMNRSLENSLDALKKDIDVETQETEQDIPDYMHLDLENAISKVIQKTKNLECAAEENIKLRKFLEGADLPMKRLRLLLWFSNEVPKEIPVHLYSHMLQRDNS